MMLPSVLLTRAVNLPLLSTTPVVNLTLVSLIIPVLHLELWISCEEFSKNLKWRCWDNQVQGGRWFMKKTWIKNLVTLPFNLVIRCFMRAVIIYMCALVCITIYLGGGGGGTMVNRHTYPHRHAFLRTFKHSEPSKKYLKPKGTYSSTEIVGNLSF
jgi:hypothetical protein